MTVTVNLHTEEQEKALIEFLENMHYDYQRDIDSPGLTEGEKSEILRRDNDFIGGKTTARNWEDIKRDLESVYR